jgi:opacity protein-like surface antigen
MNRIFVVLLISGFCCVTPTQAGSYFIGLDAGVSKLTEFCKGSTTGFNCKDTEPAVALNGGYQINDKFGVELAYADYGQAKTSGLLFGSTLNITEKITGFRVSGTAAYPLSSALTINGKLGISSVEINASTTITPGTPIPSYTASSTSLAYGLGIQYALSKAIAVRVQYENLGKTGDQTLGTDTLTFFSIGIRYFIDSTPPRKVFQRSGDHPAGTKAPPKPIRVILFLEQPPAEDLHPLTQAITTACKCQSDFVRLYNTRAVVYQLNLNAGQSFDSVKSDLLIEQATLGLTALTEGK